MFGTTISELLKLRTKRRMLQVLGRALGFTAMEWMLTTGVSLVHRVVSSNQPNNEVLNCVPYPDPRIQRLGPLIAILF